VKLISWNRKYNSMYT